MGWRRWGVSAVLMVTAGPAALFTAHAAFYLYGRWLEQKAFASPGGSILRHLGGNPYTTVATDAAAAFGWWGIWIWHRRWLNAHPPSAPVLWGPALLPTLIYLVALAFSCQVVWRILFEPVL
jgi:hypothetical protein